MKIAPYVEKLNSSEEYKKFAEGNKDSFMIAGFFILDFETGQNLHQIDYYVPSKKKVAAFTLDEGVSMRMLDIVAENSPEKLNLDTKTDLDELKGILEDEMKNRNITENIKKIIAVIQNVKGKIIWNLNCVLSGMELLRAHVEDKSKSVLKMEKVSMMELMKQIPPEQMQKLRGKAQARKQKGGLSEGAVSMGTKPSKKEKIEKLEKLKEAIDAEEKRIEEGE